MLPWAYSYCFLDFETTWLSHAKDDVIQVGLILTDAQLQVTHSWSSFINPWYDIQKLKTIVSYTTWISIDQIQSGIPLSEFSDYIRSILPEKCIFVWQNITFDLKFLVKYKIIPATYLIPSYHRFIDTLEPAKALIHYAWSYSLDIIYPIVANLYGAKAFLEIASQVWLTAISNHDALSDCVICIGMMRYFIQKIEGIITSFPIVGRMISKSQIRYLQPSDTPWNQWWSKIPLLNFPVKSPWSTIVDQSYHRWSVQNNNRLYYGDMPIEQLIRSITGVGNVIIATNSKSKLLMIKAACKRMGLNSLSFAKEQQQVSKEKLNRIFSKEQLEPYEWWFLIKYCSHKLQWLGLLDLNTPGDYKVYNYTRDDQQTEKSSMILVTHSGLFSLIENGEVDQYMICFLDQERRYNSYLKYITTPWDPVNFARVLDNYLYKYTNDNQSTLSQVLSSLTILVELFCGVLSIEVEKQLMSTQNTTDQYIELWVLYEQVWFEKTSHLFEKIRSTMEELNERHDDLWQWEYTSDRWVIYKQFEKCSLYMSSIVNVSTVSSDYTSYNFTIANKFVEYSEFMELIKNEHCLFFSNRNTTRKYVHSLREQEWVSNDEKQIVQPTHVINPGIIEHPLGEPLSDVLIPWSTAYILTNHTTIAKKLFEELMQRDSQQSIKSTLLVENVTWGRGKCLAVGKNKTSMVLVWWYEMLLQSLQEKIGFSKIIIYGDMWLLHSQIIQDVNYWMSQLK